MVLVEPVSPSRSTIIWIMEKKNLVGARVKLARKKASPPITQIDLVAHLQIEGMRIDQSGLSKLENGRRPVTDTEIIALAKALKVSVSWLLEGDK